MLYFTQKTTMEASCKINSCKVRICKKCKVIDEQIKIIQNAIKDIFKQNNTLRS